jgi:hypothetical protein
VKAVHAAPILAALRGNGYLRVSDGSVKNGTVPPYVVPYIVVSTPEETCLEDVADRVECTATIHSVAGNADAVRTVSDQVWSSLLGIRPTIVGRDCSRIRLVESRPPVTDESTGVLVLDQVDVYQFVSSPAGVPVEG